MGIQENGTTDPEGLEGTPDIRTALGIDEDNLTWEALAACRGWDVNFFFDFYEDDVSLRPLVDRQCMSCPVQYECGNFAKRNKKEGVWGGVYWTPGGDPDKTKNSHKTPQEWAEIENTLQMDLSEAYE